MDTRPDHERCAILGYIKRAGYVDVVICSEPSIVVASGSTIWKAMKRAREVLAVTRPMLPIHGELGPDPDNSPAYIEPPLRRVEDDDAFYDCDPADPWDDTAYGPDVYDQQSPRRFP